MSLIQSHYLGLVPFEQAYRLQRNLFRKRLNGEIPDQLLLLEHPPVITLGRNTKNENLLISSERLNDLSIQLVETDRGGDVTYHGPGQLIGYPIIDLQPDRVDVLRYLRDLEDVLVRILGSFGIKGSRKSGYTGVWVEDKKIASIGVKISRWVTYHGFALNVATDLSAFDLIVPCGIQDVAMTSMEKELGCDQDIKKVARVTAQEMLNEFDSATKTSNRSGRNIVESYDVESEVTLARI